MQFQKYGHGNCLQKNTNTEEIRTKRSQSRINSIKGSAKKYIRHSIVFHHNVGLFLLKK